MNTLTAEQRAAVPALESVIGAPSAAPPPDEHKCGYICNHCKQHFPGYAQYWGHKCKTATLPESSDAPTPETNEAAFGTGRVSVDFARRLERERDEARAELAKRSGDSHIDAPPTEGSAEEWVEERLFTQWDDDGNPQWYLCKTDALKLARRADEAEAELADSEKKLTLIGERAVVDWDNNTVREVDAAVKGSSKYNDWLRYVLTDVPAQLAAAQAEVRELREALELIMANMQRIDAIPWGNDGDGGASDLAEDSYAIARAALAKKEGER